jgi:hypothetical protein
LSSDFCFLLSQSLLCLGLLSEFQLFPASGFRVQNLCSDPHLTATPMPDDPWQSTQGRSDRFVAERLQENFRLAFVARQKEDGARGTLEEEI